MCSEFSALQSQIPNPKSQIPMLAFSTSPRFVEHETGPHHPERPDRIRAIAKAVREAGLISSPFSFPDFDLELGSLPSAPAKMLELPDPTPADERWLRLVHPQEVIDRVRHVCEVGGGVLDQGDTPVGPTSFDIARRAVGALLDCCDAVATGKAKRAFAAVRPPGHHAEPDRPMGFCLFSNIAIAARYLQQHHGLGKLAIVDFDVHHGNGTQATFEPDPSVLFISLHQHPRTLYPGSGYDWETGTGAGVGTTLNLPMNPGSTDADYLSTFHSRVLPTLDAYRPEMLLISAGFDAHRDDPLAQINLSEEGFEQMTRLLVQSGKTHCAGRIVSTLEGGYNLRALARSAVRHLIALGE
jgi:acetoin utilization deacetylase AcuC-like enzyme